MTINYQHYATLIEAFMGKAESDLKTVGRVVADILPFLDVLPGGVAVNEVIKVLTIIDRIVPIGETVATATAAALAPPLTPQSAVALAVELLQAAPGVVGQVAAAVSPTADPPAPPAASQPPANPIPAPPASKLEEIESLMLKGAGFLSSIT